MGADCAIDTQFFAVSTFTILDAVSPHVLSTPMHVVSCQSQTSVIIAACARGATASAKMAVLNAVTRANWPRARRHSLNIVFNIVPPF
jgi:hypothetical protein